MAGYGNDQILESNISSTSEVVPEPPKKKARFCASEDERVPTSHSNVDEPLSSDNGDSGFDDIGSRFDESSSDSEEGSANFTKKALSWVKEKMQSGADPRPLLAKLIPGVMIPLGVSRMVLWDIVIELVGEDSHFHKVPRQRLTGVVSLDDALHLLTTSKKVLVLTGAGVSVSCGIPDFRSKNGIYARLRRDFPSLPNPQAMFDMRFFLRDPRPFFKFAREIFPGQFKPSASHYFIHGLEKRNQLLRNYTQNIDTLEQSCGLERVIACHGGFTTATCTRCKYKVNCETLREEIFCQRVPLCPVCPQPEVQPWERLSLEDSENDTLTEIAVMKPDIVFFGEGLPEEFHVQINEDQTEADLLIVMGSSLKVRPVASIPRLMPTKIPQILINKEPLNHIDPFDVQLLGSCDVIIRELCSRLDGWKDEKWLVDKPPEEPEHPYEVLDKLDTDTVPDNEPSIYRVAENIYAFGGAELNPTMPISDDDDGSSSCSSLSDGSDISELELIEDVVASMVDQVLVLLGEESIVEEF